jgi:hypothetical protein
MLAKTPGTQLANIISAAPDHEVRHRVAVAIGSRKSSTWTSGR